MSVFIVQAAAKMPGKCKGRYRRIGLLEVFDGLSHVSMISKHARGVIRVVQTWEKLHAGNTKKCAFERALATANRMAEELNRHPAEKIALEVLERLGKENDG
jgi:hypothetical protein